MLSPGLRIGYVRAPQALRGPLAVAKQAADLQYVDRRAARGGALARHARPRRATSRRSPRTTARAATRSWTGLKQHLPAGSKLTEPEGGLFIWVELPDGHDAEAILPRALDRGVAFVPGKYFYAGEAPRGTLRVSFATATPDELREGAARLGAACMG